MPANIHLHLPSEILAIIINELASDNDKSSLAALASCRFASHLFCSLATPPFFLSIKLTDFPEGMLALRKRATKLNQILTNHHIVASVQILTLRCDLASLENSTLISAILHRLPHIRNFTLEAWGNKWAEPQSFFDLQKDFISAIRALCRSPNLTTLQLDNVRGFPFAIITTSPNLRCLCLSSVKLRFGNANSMDETSTSQFLYLDSLAMDLDSLYSLSSGISNDKIFAKHFSRIKNLQLKDLFCDTIIWSYGWNLMLLASHTLTTLDLSMGAYVTVQVLDSVPFDLGRFPALRHFKIQRRDACQNNLAHLRFLSQLLSISSSSSGLETLEIEITWHSVADGHGKDFFSSDAGWSSLDQLLTSEGFASLNKVVLRLGLEIEIQPSDSDQRILDLERNLTLPYVNNLFPLFRALKDTQDSVEIHLDVVKNIEFVYRFD